MPHSKRQLEERQMRKERILSGALQVFKKNGIDGATMDEIANESGFGKATLYYYFKSKEDVLTAILLDGWLKIWESLEPVIAEQHSPRKTFVNVLIKIMPKMLKIGLDYLSFLFNVPKVVKIENQPWKEYQDRLYSVIKGLIEDGVKSGEFPNINPTICLEHWVDFLWD